MSERRIRRGQHADTTVCAPVLHSSPADPAIPADVDFFITSEEHVQSDVHVKVETWNQESLSFKGM